MTALLLVLFALQSVFVSLRTDYPTVAALHPLDGFLIPGLATGIARQAWRLRRDPAPDAVPGSAPVAAEAE